MLKKLTVITIGLLLVSFAAAGTRQEDRERLQKIEQSLRDDIPRILCVNADFATGAQPTNDAFPKLAANGFRSVLNLRTANEGADLKAEQEAAEKSGLKYINIPIVSSAPKPEQVDEFIKAVKDTSNQPMLIHCASANRVGAFWLIYRVVDQGWSEDKALAEATQIGLTSPVLKKFAQDYIAAHKPEVKSPGSR
jgi:uncharacterized protein (TIGR01244 family)